MIRTRVGYAGGKKSFPTYYSLGDHTETIEIDFDPAVISYEDLLEVFWANHNPYGEPWSRQYMSIILYHNEGQRRVAQRSRDRRKRASGAKPHTEIQPLETFYFAESYHQKYRLQNHSALMAENPAYVSRGRCPFVGSTVAARLNGYIAGYGTREQLGKERKGMGLSREGYGVLKELLRRSTR